MLTFLAKITVSNQAERSRLKFPSPSLDKFIEGKLQGLLSMKILLLTQEVLGHKLLETGTVCQEGITLCFPSSFTPTAFIAHPSLGEDTGQLFWSASLDRRLTQIQSSDGHADPLPRITWWSQQC